MLHLTNICVSVVVEEYVCLMSDDHRKHDIMPNIHHNETQLQIIYISTRIIPNVRGYELTSR